MSAAGVQRGLHGDPVLLRAGRRHHLQVGRDGSAGETGHDLHDTAAAVRRGRRVQFRPDLHYKHVR